MTKYTYQQDIRDVYRCLQTQRGREAVCMCLMYIKYLGRKTNGDICRYVHKAVIRSSLGVEGYVRTYVVEYIKMRVLYMYVGNIESLNHTIHGCTSILHTLGTCIPTYVSSESHAPRRQTGLMVRGTGWIGLDENHRTAFFFLPHCRYTHYVQIAILANWKPWKPVGEATPGDTRTLRPVFTQPLCLPSSMYVCM